LEELLFIAILLLKVYGMDETGKTNHDELIIVQVMTGDLDKEWWKQFKQSLEQIFRQDEMLIRSILFKKL
jgi:hypothetical protein